MEESVYDQQQIEQQVREIVEELTLAAHLGPGKLLVIGVSTSEVGGQRIGTSGALDVAEQLYSGIESVRVKYGFDIAYQCCEHLNRALVLERSVLDSLRLTEVAAVPVRHAGGSMAATVYRKLNDPCLAESLEAHAGLDIGETLIGMHLKRVAVPFRPEHRYIGQARVTAAITRPKLIGGERAVYAMPAETEDSHLCD